jgi:hypothetical protein
MRVSSLADQMTWPEYPTLFMLVMDVLAYHHEGSVEFAHAISNSRHAPVSTVLRKIAALMRTGPTYFLRL